MRGLLLILGWPFRGSELRRAAQAQARARLYEEKPHAPLHVVNRIRARWAEAERDRSRLRLVR